LVVKHSRLGAKGYIAAERVKAIYAERVETDLTPQEAESLPPYAEPKTTVWHADTGEGRFKRAFRDLFGRRR
ncbi:MAG TPA: hypothetical protein VLJ76_04555, partial [Gaiellaceae bacterium]|nr:hypothetical protein [Gaiellaceae bacterium]